MDDTERAPQYPEELSPEELSHRDGPDPDPLDDADDVLIETEDFADFDDGRVDRTDVEITDGEGRA